MSIITNYVEEWLFIVQRRPSKRGFKAGISLLFGAELSPQPRRVKSKNDHSLDKSSFGHLNTFP